MKNLATVRGRQYIDSFSELTKKHIYPIAGTVNEMYNQFQKQDANYLCTKTFAQYFAKQELYIPWNIIICDEDQECDPNNYAFGTHDIEVILLFKVSDEESIQVTISVGTVDALVEYRKCVNGNWYTVYNEYVSTSETSEVKKHPKHRTILDYCERQSKARLQWPSYTELPE